MLPVFLHFYPGLSVRDYRALTLEEFNVLLAPILRAAKET